MLVVNCAMKDVELYYYDAVFTLESGNIVDLAFGDLSYEQVMENDYLGIHSKGAWSILCNDSLENSTDIEIEIRSIDFEVMLDHENKITGGMLDE